MAADASPAVITMRDQPKGFSDRNPRICMVCGTYPPARCGVADGLRILSENIAARGAEVSVITSSYLGISPTQGNPKVLPVVKRWMAIDGWRVLRTILATRPDIVHFQFPNGEYRKRMLFNLLVPMIKIVRRSTRVVVTFHEFLKREELGWRKFLYISRILVSVVVADAVIFVAPEYAEVLRRLGPLAQRVPYTVVRNASNIPRSALNSDALVALRQQLGINQTTILLSYFGFTHPGKGFEDLLSIVSTLRRQGRSVRLLVLGELSRDNEYHRRLLNRIDGDGLAASVTLLGRLDQASVANHLAASDAAIFPFTEGVHAKAGSLLAATEQGIFTLTTSSSRQGFVEAENVYYARPRDLEEMTTAVLRYAGRRVRPDSLPWRTCDEVADDNFRIYMDLLARNSQVSQEIRA